VKYALTFAAGLAIGAHFLRAKDSACCERVAIGARDKLSGLLGPFSGIASGFLDGTGLTKLLPGLLDGLGVPKDA
jgi:hypothetical protein